ncbi:CAP domain-containing protein [Candidatus Gracilibacteria bacterium]|nr:CAP domain-containing protein [Candidatus Gracilibacteria bacterium]
MKKTLLLCLILTLNSYALSGVLEVRTEKLYDMFMTQTSTNTVSKSIEKISNQIKQQLQKTSLSTNRRGVLNYLGHMFCMTKSLTDGVLCRDNYHNPESDIMKEKDTMSLDELRSILLTEHNIRRKNRGLGEFEQSEKLDAIAQKYALNLCQVGQISHGLNGSTLSQRYDDGGYDYQLGAENLGLGQTTVAELLDQLTTSIGHRENMYHEDLRELGIGQCDNIWVLNYGSR